MLAPKNKTQPFLARETRVEISQVNAIKKLNAFTDNAVDRLRAQMERLHIFSKTAVKKKTSALEIDTPIIQKGKTDNLNFKLPALLFFIGAIVSNLLSLYFQFSGDILAVTNIAKFAVSLWVVSVILAGISAWLYSATAKKNQTAITKERSLISRLKQSGRVIFSSRSFRFLVPILFLAFILRIISIMNNGLYLDEWYWLRTSKSILSGSVITPFGFVGDQPSNLPAFPLALLLAVVKNPVLSVRLMGVIYSLVTICFVYQLLKHLLGFKIAVVGSFLLAVSAWDVHTTNLGWNNVVINPILASGTLLLLYKIYKDKYSIRTLFLLALVLSICLHLLYVAAILIIPALLVLAIHWFRNHSSAKLREAAIFCTYFFICLSPMAPKLIQYPQLSLGRHIGFFQKNITMAEQATSSLTYYLGQVRLLSQDYFMGAKNFNQEGLWGISLDPAIQLLSILGMLLLIIQIIRKKDDPFWLIIFFTFCTLLLIPFVFLYRTDSVWRAYIILPLVYLFAAYSISHLAKFLKKIAKIYHHPKGLRKLSLVGITLLYFIVSIPWFVAFSKVYMEKSTGYESTICQYAANLINIDIPRGSTILIPDEMCAPLITVLYNNDQYHFIPITPDNQKPVVEPGFYLIILNSQAYGGYFKENIQKIAEQIITEHAVKSVSAQLTSRPVVYLIK
jgi:hypothetical protein